MSGQEDLASSTALGVRVCQVISTAECTTITATSLAACGFQREIAGMHSRPSLLAFFPQTHTTMRVAS
jgi:hypothetical protein